MDFSWKYPPLPGQFVYKNFSWCSWSSLEIIQRIENDMKFFPDDIIIASFPKTGTTLLQEIVWLIVNNVDIDRAKKTNLHKRMVFIDENDEHRFPLSDKQKYLDQFPRPRIMKTHLPFRILNKQLDNNPLVKVLIPFRNPKDTAVSFYNFYKGMKSYYGSYNESWDTFFDRWIDGWITGGDFLEVYKEWWLQRHRPNLKIIFYEDMVNKKLETIKSICEFLNVNLTDEQVQKIVDHTKFSEMKSNSMTNYQEIYEFNGDFSFMRKGEVGEWKSWLTVAQNEALDKKYDRTLKEIGLQFKYG